MRSPHAPLPRSGLVQYLFCETKLEFFKTAEQMILLKVLLFSKVIPTRLERIGGSMRGKIENLSEWALKSLKVPQTLNQRVVGSSPTAPTNILMT
jgi:hypothetical protein